MNKSNEVIEGYIGKHETPKWLIKNIKRNCFHFVTNEECESLGVTKKVKIKIEIEEI